MTQPDKYFKYLDEQPIVPKPGDLIRSLYTFQFVNLVLRVEPVVDEEGRVDLNNQWVHSVRYAQMHVRGYLYGSRVRPFKWHSTYGHYRIRNHWYVVVEYRPVDSQDVIQRHLESLKGKDLYYNPRGGNDGIESNN